jgi:hypothetical protein
MATPERADRAKNKWAWTMAGLIPPEELEAHPTLHFCTEWDGLVIEEGDPEFEACLCFFGQ